MKERNLNCKYCGGELVNKTTRAEFCSTKCRVYWNRENITEVVEENNKPENKQRIIKERNNVPQKPITGSNPLLLAEMEKEFQETVKKYKK